MMGNWGQDFSEAFARGMANNNQRRAQDMNERHQRFTEEQMLRYETYREKVFQATQQHQRWAEKNKEAEDSAKKRLEDNAIGQQMYTMLSNPSVTPELKSAMYDHFGRQLGQDPKSEQFQTTKKILLKAPVDQCNAMTSSIITLLGDDTMKPGWLKESATALCSGGIPPAQIPDLIVKLHQRAEEVKSREADQDMFRKLDQGQQPGGQQPTGQSAPAPTPTPAPQQPQSDAGQQFDQTMFADDLGSGDMPGTNLGSSPSASPGMEGQLGQMQGVLDQASGEGGLPSSPGAMPLGMDTPISRNAPLSRNAPIQMPGAGAPAGAGTDESPFQITQDASAPAPSAAPMPGPTAAMPAPAPSAPFAPMAPAAAPAATPAPSAVDTSSQEAPSDVSEPLPHQTSKYWLEAAAAKRKRGLPGDKEKADEWEKHAKAIDEANKVAGEILKTDTEGRKTKSDARTSAVAGVQRIDETLRQIANVATHPGLVGVLGNPGAFEVNVPWMGTLATPELTSGIGKGGSQAADFYAQHKNLVSRNVVDTMSDLKRLSSQGATGFGALNEKELDILKNDAAALSIRQSPEAYKGELLKLAARLVTMRDRITDDFKSGSGKELPVGSTRPLKKFLQESEGKYRWNDLAKYFGQL